jgi:hypothetical protein
MSSAVSWNVHLTKPWHGWLASSAALPFLAADRGLAARFAARDPAAGYNTWAGYAEEDAAQALDQLLNTRLGRNTRGTPVTRWTTADDGMHVLALLLYDTLLRGGFDPATGSYADFLADALADTNTWPPDLEARYLELIQHPLDQRGLALSAAGAWVRDVPGGVRVHGWVRSGPESM